MRDYYQCHVEAPTSEPSPLTRPPCLWQAGSGQCHDVNQSVGNTRTQTEQGALTFGNAVELAAGQLFKVPTNAFTVAYVPDGIYHLLERGLSVSSRGLLRRSIS